MAADLLVSPRANDHIAEAAEWYDSKQEGLGDQFLASIEHCLAQICDHPQIYMTVDNINRRALLERFPYAIYFSFENNLVIVHGVCHTARNSSKWHKWLFEHQ